MPKTRIPDTPAHILAERIVRHSERLHLDRCTDERLDELAYDLYQLIERNKRSMSQSELYQSELLLHIFYSERANRRRVREHRQARLARE